MFESLDHFNLHAFEKAWHLLPKASDKLWTLIGFFFFVISLRKIVQRLQRRSIRYLRGPPVDSWLVGWWSRNDYSHGTASLMYFRQSSSSNITKWSRRVCFQMGERIWNCIQNQRFHQCMCARLYFLLLHWNFFSRPTCSLWRIPK